MGSNAAILINMSLQAALQLQQYQAALAKAAAEGRDVSDAEVQEALRRSQQAIDGLKAA